jgi:3-hydroxybutyrate dehydrogenase
MAKPNEISELITLGEKSFGSVDVLVNNAGVQHVAPIEEFPVDKWNAIIGINLSSAFHTIRAAVPGMKKRGCTTASAHSLVASPFKSAYVAAKHGIVGLTKTVALELARSKITNCISPGYVWTPLVEKQIPNTMKARSMSRDEVINDVLLAAQPTKEFVTVEQVATLALPVWRRRRANHRRQLLYRRRLDGRIGAADRRSKPSAGALPFANVIGRRRRPPIRR